MGDNWQIEECHMANLTENVAKFIFDHAEKQLKDLIDTGNIITTRTTTLITVVVGLLIAIISYFINRWDTKQYFDSLTTTSIIVVIYLLVICFYLRMNILPKEYAVPGAAPKLFFKDSIFGEKSDEQNRLRNLYINEIESYQKRIEHNKATNNERWKHYNQALLLVVLLPIVMPVIFFIISIFCC